MKSLISILIFFTWSVPSLFGSEIEFNSTISLAELNIKRPKHSWCLFTKGNSSTDISEISTRLSGDTKEYTQFFAKDGKQYLARKIEWENSTTDKSFSIKFRSENSNFHGSHVVKENTCSYSTWEGQTSRTSNILTAKAAFRIPPNVWVIKIKTLKKIDKSNTQIKLFNMDLKSIQTEDGGTKYDLEKKELFSFNGSNGEYYFIVKPSNDEVQNDLFLELKKSNLTSDEDELNLDFNISFIAQEECIDSSDNIGNFWQSLNTTNQESAIKNLSCMLAPDYIKGTLSSLFLYGVNDFFETLDGFRKKMESNVGDDEENLSRLNIIKELIKRIRFYYSFEISKEIVSLLKYGIKVDGSGKALNAFEYLDYLRNMGIIKTNVVLGTLSNIIKDVRKKNKQVYLNLDSSDKYILETVGNQVLKVNVLTFKKLYERLPRSYVLSTKYLDSLKKSVNDFANSYFEFQKILNTALDSSKSPTIGILNDLDSAMEEMSLRLMSYIDSWHGLLISTGPENLSPSEIVEIRENYLSQVDSLYQLNVKSLRKNLNEYFVRYFEDPSLKKINIDGKTYNSVDEFIADFDLL